MVLENLARLKDRADDPSFSEIIGVCNQASEAIESLRKDRERLERCQQWGASFSWEDGRVIIRHATESDDGHPGWTQTAAYTDFREAIDAMKVPV